MTGRITWHSAASSKQGGLLRILLFFVCFVDQNFVDAILVHIDNFKAERLPTEGFAHFRNIFQNVQGKTAKRIEIGEIAPGLSG